MNLIEIGSELCSKIARTYKITFEIEPAIYLSVWGDHRRWELGDFRAKTSGQIVGQKIEQFPKFMQNNEKTTVFKVLSLKNGRFFGAVVLNGFEKLNLK